MAKAADETHAIHLPRFFLEPPDEEHVAKGGQFLFLAESGAVHARVLCFRRRGFAAVRRSCGGHEKPFCNAGGGGSDKNSSAPRGKRAPCDCSVPARVRGVDVKI